MRWITDIEITFHTSYFLEEAKVRYATSLLRDTTKDWVKLSVTLVNFPVEIVVMIWHEFSTLFVEEFVPIVGV